MVRRKRQTRASSRRKASGIRQDRAPNTSHHSKLLLGDHRTSPAFDCLVIHLEVQQHQLVPLQLWQSKEERRPETLLRSHMRRVFCGQHGSAGGLLALESGGSFPWPVRMRVSLRPKRQTDVDASKRMQKGCFPHSVCALKREAAGMFVRGGPSQTNLLACPRKRSRNATGNLRY